MFANQPHRLRDLILVLSLRDRLRDRLCSRFAIEYRSHTVMLTRARLPDLEFANVFAWLVHVHERLRQGDPELMHMVMISISSLDLKVRHFPNPDRARQE